MEQTLVLVMLIVIIPDRASVCLYLCCIRSCSHHPGRCRCVRVRVRVTLVLYDTPNQTSHLHPSGSNSQSKNNTARTLQATQATQSMQNQTIKEALVWYTDKMASVIHISTGQNTSKLPGTYWTARPLLHACLDTQGHRLLLQIPE